MARAESVAQDPLSGPAALAGREDAWARFSRKSRSAWGAPPEKPQGWRASVALRFAGWLTRSQLLNRKCPYEENSTEIRSRRKICRYSPSLWSPTCYICSGVLLCGQNNAPQKGLGAGGRLLMKALESSRDDPTPNFWDQRRRQKFPPLGPNSGAGKKQLLRSKPECQ